MRKQPAPPGHQALHARHREGQQRGRCAVCHTTKLKVGDKSTYSLTHGQASERTFQYAKGASYPIWLIELSRSLPATTNVGNTPQTNGKYDAYLLPATNTLPAAFVVQDPNTRLGTNRLVCPNRPLAR